MTATSSSTQPTLTANDLIGLEQLGDNRFRSNLNLDNLMGAVFGGQLLGQAVEAARRTVPSWPIHSCAGYFLRKVSVDQPIDYEVETTNDSRRFSTRRVSGLQDGKMVFDLLSSFHDPEDSYAHQTGDLGQVPAPESLQTLGEFARANADRLPAPLLGLYNRPFPIEMRPIEPEHLFLGESSHKVRSLWFRVPSATTIDDPRDHHSLLAFMSDYWLAGAAGAPHRTAARKQGQLSVASQNHSMWFHNPVRVDQWLLYHTESPWAGEGRGLATGSIYDQSGILIASTVQEVSMRVR